MDVKMPEMDGLEATRLIRAFNQSIPIIAQTAYAMSDDEQKAKEAGCNDYISKPIRRKALIDMIEKYTKGGSI
jgi:CheY-like chemotaxis protein